MSNIEKIRQEIERRKELLTPHKGQGAILCREIIKQFDSLLSFIDTISIKKDDIIDEIRTEIERRFSEYNHDSNHHIQAAECASILAFIDSLPEDDPLNDPRFGDGFDAGRKVQKIFDEPKEHFRDSTKMVSKEQEEEIPKVKGWIARNKDGSLVFCYHKPKRENSITQEWWGSCDADFRIYDDTIDEQFKDLKWEDEPREVELIIKCGTCKESLQVQETCKENQDSFTSLEEAAKDYAILPMDVGDGLVCIDKKKERAFIAGAKWMRSQMPMPEDTVIFMKGVAEGRRLEREDRNDDNLPKFYGD